MYVTTLRWLSRSVIHLDKLSSFLIIAFKQTLISCINSFNKQIFTLKHAIKYLHSLQQVGNYLSLYNTTPQPLWLIHLMLDDSSLWYVMKERCFPVKIDRAYNKMLIHFKEVVWKRKWEKLMKPLEICNDPLKLSQDTMKWGNFLIFIMLSTRFLLWPVLLY